MLKALELLYQYQQADGITGGYMSKPIGEAIEFWENLKKEAEENICSHGAPKNS